MQIGVYSPCYRPPYPHERRMRRHLPAIAGYAALTLLLFAPILPGFTATIPGGPVAAVDGWQHVWHLWWTERALSSGQSPLFTPLLYHPFGVDLSVHPLTLSNGLLVLPLTAWLGPIAAYNLAAIAAVLLSALAAYALALQVGARPGPAFVAGLIFAFSPYHLSRLWDGQLELVATQWIACFALGLLLAATRPGWHAPLLAAVALALVGYGSLYYLVFCAVLGVAMALLWLPWRGDQRAIAAYLARLAAVPLLATLLLAPMLGGLLGSFDELRANEGREAILDDFLVLRSANLLDFVLPSHLHPLWGPAVDRVGDLLHPGIAAWNSALGYTAIALAALGAWSAWQRAWRWVALTAIALVLALGPLLSVGTYTTSLPLPYQLLLAIPGMGLARRPSHFVVLATLALVPLAALGLGALADRLGRPRAVLAVAAALLIVEYIPAPLPRQVAVVHPVYRSLAGQPGALLVVPEISKISRSLQRQMVHGRPIVGGYLARTLPYSLAEELPGLRQLWRMRPEASSVTLPLDELGPLGLRSIGVTQVVVELNDLLPEERVRLEAALGDVLPGLEPSFADEAVRVYDVPAAPLRPFAYFGAGWHREERDEQRSWRWMGAEAELVLMNPLPEPRPVRLLLRGDSYLQPRTVQFTLDGRPAGGWEFNPGAGLGSVELRLLLPPGESRLLLRAPTDPEPRGPLSVLLSEVRIVE